MELPDEICTTPGRDASTASVKSCGRRNVGALLKRGKGMPPQLTRFQVELENQNRVYFAGEELEGFVHVEINEDLPVQGIIVRIVGEAYVNVADEPRPWTAAKRRLKRSFRNRKIRPNTFSDQTDISDAFFFREPDPPMNWETATTTTISGPRSQRSTLQRDQLPPPLMTDNIPKNNKPKAKGRKKRVEEARFCAHEKYFEHKVYVFGHRYSSTREVIWKGKHVYPFSYSLPSKLPVSFHGRFGYVRYFCEASLERHGHPTVQRRAFFSVSNIMDLNNDSKADAGVSKEKKTNSWCFCCPSGTIIVSAKIRKRGFVPGEMIPLQAYVFNVSNKPVNRITARIIQIATYFSSKGFQKRADETIVCEKFEGLLPPGESTIWDECGPVVPPLPPSSTMIDCKLITLDYRLEFVLDIAKAKEPMILRMPLRIGTIPLEKVFKNLVDPTMTLDFVDERSSFPPAICSKYPKIPAVLSLKCIKGDRNVNRYYFRQIPRSMNSMLGVSGRVPLQPTISDEDEVYAPRYLTYIMCPEKLKSGPEPRSAAKNLKNGRKIFQNGNAGNHIRINISSAHQKLALSNGPNRLIMSDTHALGEAFRNGDGLPSIISNGHEGAASVLSDVSIGISNGSPVRVPSSLCSPASFRSYNGISAQRRLKEFSNRLANINWDGAGDDGLRRRQHGGLGGRRASEQKNEEMKSVEDESKDDKKEK